MKLNKKRNVHCCAMCMYGKKIPRHHQCTDAVMELNRPSHHITLFSPWKFGMGLTRLVQDRYQSPYRAAKNTLLVI